jgi:hypothetical protein
MKEQFTPGFKSNPTIKKSSMPTAKESAIHGITEEMKYFVRIIGTGFHPDTDCENYIDVHTKQRWFKQREAARLNMRLQQAIDLSKKYEIDIYAIALEALKEQKA